MARDIDSYLRELQAALAGADPALVQDALFDTEEHLRAEMASLEPGRADGPAEAEARFEVITERYGTPDEVAAAYLVVAERTQAEIGAATVDRVAPVPTSATTADGASLERVPGGATPSAVPVATAGETTPTEASTPGPAAGAAAPGGEPRDQGPQPDVGVAGPGSAWARFFGVVVDKRAWSAFLYMILSLATGIAYFTIVVTGISLSAGLLILIIGIPVLLLFLGVVRGLSLFEGRLVEALLGTRMPRRPRGQPLGAGLVQSMWFWVKDSRTWVAMVYMLLQLPLGIVYFSLAVTGLAVGLWLMVLPFIQLIAGHTFIYYSGHWFILHVWEMPFLVIVGALFFVIWLHVVRGIGRAHARYAKSMLVRLAK